MPAWDGRRPATWPSSSRWRARTCGGARAEHRAPHRDRAAAGERGAYAPPAAPGDGRRPGGPAALRLVVGTGGAVGGAFMHTPPHPLLLTAVAARRGRARRRTWPAGRCAGERPPRGGRAFAAGWRDGTTGPRGAGTAGSGCTGSRARLAGPGAGRRATGRRGLRRAAADRLVRRLRDEVDDGPGRTSGRRAREDQPRRHPGLGGGGARSPSRRHQAGGRHGQDRPGLHAAGAARHGYASAVTAAVSLPGAGSGAERSCSTPTWPIRCPIRSTSGSATAPVEDRVVLAFSAH